MYYSSSLSKHVLLVPFVLVVAATQLLFICNASSLNLTNTYLHHKCLDREGYYKQGSAYEFELKRFIRYTATTNFRDGFMQMGRVDDHMTSTTIIYQCRGDSYWAKCRPCYDAATSELLRRCPGNKGGITWFDQCFVEFTTVSVGDALPRIDYDNIVYVHNPKKVSGDAKLFNKETMSFLEKLILKANDKNNKDDDKIALYASGEKSLGTKKLYAMVQCTRFIFMARMCKVCLDTMIMEHFSKCCNGRQGGRVLSTSCNFRYELYPFLRTNKTV